MKALVIVDESADDARRVTHGMDLALELVRAEDRSVRVFLLGATVDLARADGPGRTPAHGGAVGRLVSGGVEVAVSEAEMAARGVRPEDLILGAQPASSSTLAAWTLEADRVLVFWSAGLYDPCPTFAPHSRRIGSVRAVATRQPPT